MGMVFKDNAGKIKAYPSGIEVCATAVVEPGTIEAQVPQEEMTPLEMEIFTGKLDALANQTGDPRIAEMVSRAYNEILTAVRWVKTETHSAFRGMAGKGSELDIMWLRPKDVGGAILRGTAAAGTLGLYGGGGGAVYTWLQTFVANTADDIIPAQTMLEEGAVVHLGMIDSVAVPKVQAMTITLSGIPLPAQSLAFDIRPTFDENAVPFMMWEKPIIVGPEKTQQFDIMPGPAGDSKPQMLSLLIARAQDLTA